MSLFQICTRYLEMGRENNTISSSDILYALGADIVEHVWPEFGFACCVQGQTISYYWKRLCRHYEWGITGIRLDQMEKEFVPHGVQFAPKWLYPEEKIVLDDGKTIEKDGRLFSWLEEVIREDDKEDKKPIGPGIRGGLWLYDELCREYVKAYQERKEQKEKTSFVSFQTENERIYELRQWNIHTYLARCLMLQERYRRGEKDCLQAIRLDMDPVLFLLLLCLAVSPYTGMERMAKESGEYLSKIGYVWKERNLSVTYPKMVGVGEEQQKRTLELLAFLEIRFGFDQRERKLEICF